MRQLRKDDLVILLGLPEWLIHDLPVAEQVELRGAVGRILRIEKIDEHGYVWLEFTSASQIDGRTVCSGHSFCVTPEHVNLAE